MAGGSFPSQDWLAFPEANVHRRASLSYYGSTIASCDRLPTPLACRAVRQAGAPATMFAALNDDSEEVRENVYKSLANCSTVGPGKRSKSVMGFNYRSSFVIRLQIGLSLHQ